MKRARRLTKRLRRAAAHEPLQWLDSSGRRITMVRDEAGVYDAFVASIRKTERDRIVFGLIRLLSRAPCLVMPGDNEAERESIPWTEFEDALRQVSRQL